MYDSGGGRLGDGLGCVSVRVDQTGGRLTGRVCIQVRLGRIQRDTLRTGLSEYVSSDIQVLLISIHRLAHARTRPHAKSAWGRFATKLT